MASPQSILLHTTPPLSPVPASDAKSIYLASLLTLACPGRWQITTAPWSEHAGNLPYITQLGHLVQAQHLHSLPGFDDPDEGLSREERAESLAWAAYVEMQVTDLVNHTLYSLPPNYTETVGKSRLAGLSFPQNLYVPQRIRGLVKARLEYVGLWGVGGLNQGDLADEERAKMEDAFVVGTAGTIAPKAWSGFFSGREASRRRTKFGEEEIVRRAKGVFEPLQRRLGDASYFFGDRPTTLDLALFAQLTLVLTPSLPNPLLPTLLRFSFPALVSHHDRLLSVLFPGPLPWSTVPLTPESERIDTSWSEWLNSFWSTETKREGNQVSKKEMEFRRARWLWMAGAGGAMIVYLLASGLVQVGYLDGNIIEDAGDEMAGDGVDGIVWVLEEEDDEH